MTTHAEMVRLAGMIADVARATGGGAFFSKSDLGYDGRVGFYGTPQTGTSTAGVLSCLIALGVRRDPWTWVDTNVGPMARATLRDTNGEDRGSIIVTEDGASADLWYALSRPMRCFPEA